MSSAWPWAAVRSWFSLCSGPQPAFSRSALASAMTSWTKRETFPAGAFPAPASTAGASAARVPPRRSCPCRCSRDCSGRRAPSRCRSDSALGGVSGRDSGAAVPTAVLLAVRGEGVGAVEGGDSAGEVGRASRTAASEAVPVDPALPGEPAVPGEPKGTAGSATASATDPVTVRATDVPTGSAAEGTGVLSPLRGEATYTPVATVRTAAAAPARVTAVRKDGLRGRRLAPPPLR